MRKCKVKDRLKPSWFELFFVAFGLICLLNSFCIYLLWENQKLIPCATSSSLPEDMDSTSLLTNLYNDIERRMSFTSIALSDLKDRIRRVEQLMDFQHFADEEHSSKLERNAKDSNEYYSESTKIVERNLQSSLFMESSNNVCQHLPVLSPTNELSNSTFDGRVDQLLSEINSVSSKDLINSFTTSQYRAACWLLYEDTLLESISEELFIQRYILAVFFYATSTERGVLISKRTCDYKIIQCNEKGEIIKLDAEMGIETTVPSELSYLTSLEHLNLKKMIGTLTPEFGRLKNLQILNLDDSSLSGTIPSEIGNLSRLKELKLYENLFEGTIPSEIGNCEELTYFNLTNNKVGGSLPTELFDCNKLQLVDFIDNEFTGTIPTEIQKLKDLVYLRFNQNHLSGSIPSEMGLLSSIEKIWMGFNNLSGIIPEEVTSIGTLVWLVINENNLSGTLPNTFGAPLKVLSISHNPLLTGTIPFKAFDEDEYFALLFQETGLTGTVPSTFCGRAKNLKVDYSPWFRVEPKVECSCCEKPGCFLWEKDSVTVMGTRRPPCPQQNVRSIDFFQEYWAIDLVANQTSHEYHGEGLKSTEICLSPTGCYDMRDDGEIYMNYNYSYSSSTKGLTKQDQCEAVNICGNLFHMDDPKRLGINHLTQLVLTDLDVLNDPSSEAGATFCWIMTEDILYNQYKVCDGTLLQRFVLALFFMNQPNFNFENFSTQHTCEWPGIECDSQSSFVEHIHLPQENLIGSLMTELGLLTRLKSIHMNENHFQGTIDSSIFTNLLDLEIFEMGNNSIGGIIPKEALLLPKLRTLNVSNNLLVGTLPKTIKYTHSLEIIDFENNLLQGPIPRNLIDCSSLQILNLARNSFEDFIPPNIGALDKLRALILNENRLFGSIPSALFGASNIEVLLLQSNFLTGKIPSEIKKLQNATKITMSHNTLKGLIPTEFSELQNLKLLHLHHNYLTGTAPVLRMFREGKNIARNRYITDCGEPSFLSYGAVFCESCSMCCNSLDKCQVNFRPIIPNKVTGYVLVGLVIPIIIYVAIYILFYGQKILKRIMIVDDRNTLSVFNEDSVTCLIFTDNLCAWLIYASVASIQGWLFSVFLEKSDFNAQDTDWRFSFRCPNDSSECLNAGQTTTEGWIMFVLVTFFFLGTDFIDSVLQLRKAVTLKDSRFLLSGVILFLLTALALYTSIVYNFALAETDTDLIVNTVILLFINDLDEQCLNILDSAAPMWISKRYTEIEANLELKKSKFKEKPKEEITTIENPNSLSRRGSGSSRLKALRFAGISDRQLSFDDTPRGRLESGRRMLGFRGSDVVIFDDLAL